MITLQQQKQKIERLAEQHGSSQVETYKDSIFLPYVTLPNAKGKGTMMEEFFHWYLNEIGIKCQWIKTNANYDFLINDESKVELKVASIGHKNVVVFNQLHFGEMREVDKFLFAIIKPDDTIDFFVVPKEDFIDGRIKVQKQHSTDANTCARLCWPYNRMVKELEKYKVEIDNLSKKL